MNPKYPLALLLLLLLPLAFSGCFKVYERVALNHDGTGTFTLFYDLAEIKQGLSSMGADPMADDSPLAGLQADLAREPEALNAMPGIANAELVVSMEAYTLALSFDFASVEALNTAADHLLKDNDPETGSQVFYTFVDGVFTRTAYRGHLDDLVEELRKNFPQQDPRLLEAEYNIEFSFRPAIDSADAAAYTLSADKTSAGLRLFFLKPEYEKADTRATFTF